jgi:molybdate transport system substrate-binding protein
MLLKRHSAFLAAALVGTAASLLIAAAAQDVAAAAEIKVLSGSGVHPVMAELVPQFEVSSGHRVSFDYGTVGGMAQRVRNGEAADVLIATGAQIDALEQQGTVVAGSRRDLGRTGVGIFVRKGAPKPDLSSVEAFERAMLQATSIGWNDPAAGAPVSLYLIGLFEHLGIADQMRPKTTTFNERTERFAAVARGAVQIGFNQISEILSAPGVDPAGSLPAAIQHYTVFSAGIVASSGHKDAAGALIKFISSPAAQTTLKAKGFDAP